MSNRAIRKYEEALAAEAAAARASDDNVPDDVVVAEAEVGDTTEPVNMFSMLGGGDGPVSGDESGDAGAETQAPTPEAAAKGKAGDDKPKATAKGKAGSDKPSGGKRRRKGKKGKKKAAADDEDWFVGAAAPSVGDDGGGGEDNVFALPDAFFSAEDDADLRASAREILRDVVAIAYPDGIVPGEIEALAAASRALVAVSPVMLSAESELRRLFGSGVIAGDADGRRTRGRKSGRLVTPRDNWWPSAPGMTMVGDDGAVGEAILEGDDLSAGEGVEVRYFRYRFEKRYDVLQRDFEAIVRSHNPQLLVELVSRAPYHVDTLLQLGEVHRQTGELDRAGELVQRALYVLEATWTRAFKPFNGSCRLRYAVPENRSLFLALFRHMQLLAHRGLHRTALEAGKLYLNLDPPFDPLGALVIIDSLALLSGEFGWVRAMHRDYVPSSLELFPNFVVSAIVAEHCQAEAADGGRKKKSGSGKKKKKTDDRTEYVPSEKEAEQTPLQKLTGALLSFPMLAVPLLTAAGESTDVCEKYEIFSSETAALTDHDGVLVRISRIYAESSKVMWKGSTLVLLKDAIIGAGSAAAGGQGEMGLDLAAGAQELREDAVNFFRRTKAYDHLQVGDFTGNATNVPAELMMPEDDDYPVAPLGVNHAPAGDFDRREDAGVELGDGQALPMPPVPQPISRTQAAVTFFRSLLPWYTPEEEDVAPPAPVDRLEEGTWDRLQEMFSRRREDADGDAGSGEDA